MTTFLQCLKLVSLLGLIGGPALGVYGLVKDKRGLAVKGFMLTPIFAVVALSVAMIEFAVNESGNTASNGSPAGITLGH